jgi:hypothetical protein
LNHTLPSFSLPFVTLPADRAGPLCRPLALSLYPFAMATMDFIATTFPVSVSWISYNISLAALSLTLVYAISHVTYNLFLSPLSSIPGPWYAAISNFWITTHILRLRQCKINHCLLERYGPVVRVGRNKVIFRDLTSQRSIYSFHKFDKSTFYKGFLTCVYLVWHDFGLCTI